MESITVKLDFVSIVSLEWALDFMVESNNHYTLENGNRFVINEDGMWLLEQYVKSKYRLYKVLRE